MDAATGVPAIAGGYQERLPNADALLLHCGELLPRCRRPRLLVVSLQIKCRLASVICRCQLQCEPMRFRAALTVNP